MNNDVFDLSTEQTRFISRVLVLDLMTRYYKSVKVQSFVKDKFGSTNNGGSTFLPNLTAVDDLDTAFVKGRYWSHDVRVSLRNILIKQYYERVEVNMLQTVGIIYKNRKKWHL